jgi:hypothetical protein
MFRDIDTIRREEDFAQAIESALNACDVVHGHLSVARCGFRPQNRRCFRAASAEGRSKFYKVVVEGDDIKVEV